jgi:hypothetical protein
MPRHNDRMSSVSIPHRFNGPPASGNGGYACGAIAEAIGEPVEVTLRLPPPLGTTMEIVADDDRWRVLDGDRLIAEATPASLDGTVIPPPTAADAEAAMARYLGHTHHEFPGCFTCGPERVDGLGIFSGPVGDGGMVAAVWRPDDSLPTDEGGIAPPIVWAALDCPGAWTAIRTRTDAPVVLGRMAAHVIRRPRVGEALVSYAWPTGGEGRKAFATTALADTDGETIAVATQTWIALE